MKIPFMSSLTTSYCVTSTTVDDMGSLGDLYTTATSVASTISTTTNQNIDVHVTTSYMNSLSAEQLIELEERLTQKELEFEVPPVQDSNVKVYKKL